MAGSGLRHIKGLTLGVIRRELQALPIKVAERVAARGALDLSVKARSQYDSGQTVWDTPRPLGVDGRQLSLHGTGDTRDSLIFGYFGTVIRAVLGTKYARYLVGKYGVLPPGNVAMPLAWRLKLDAIVGEESARPL